MTKKTFVASQFILLFFTFIFITSCNGQGKTNMLQDSTAVSNPIPIPTPPQGDQSFNQTYIDPLFFIDGQLCAWVRNIFQDKNGNLWFGTNHYGVMRFNGDTLEYFTEKDGLGIGRITGIVEDKNGNMWFGTYGGLTKYDGKTFTNFTEKDGLINNDIWSIMIDSKGIFWIGTAEGVSRFDGEEFGPFYLPHPDIENRSFHISPNRVSCIAEDKDGNFWFGTDGYGICKYDGKTLSDGQERFTHFTKENGFIDNNVAHLMVDKKGNVWIGTMYGGVSMYDGESFNNFTQKGMIEGDEVGGFYEDKTGNIWFAAENHGVYRYDGNPQSNRQSRFTNLYKKEGLITNGILSIFEDKEGRFWFGGWGGLFRFDGDFFHPVTKEGPWH